MSAALTVRGQVAMVTGGGGGIGGACVSALLDAGLRVAVVDSRVEVAQATAEHVQDIARVRGYGVDVRDARAVSRLFDEVWSQMGVVDVLVNAAGLYPSHPLLDMSEQAWDRVFDTNLKGPHLCVQSFARKLVAAEKPGVVVNISSGAAKRARRGAAHYCASKAGLSMLTCSQALELARQGIRVNAVAPGYVEVHSTVNPISEQYAQAVADTVPLGRVGKPQDIANAVLFLCSEQARWISGSVLAVDGGASAGSLGLPFSGS
jgi:NAD(P)-dependent dehydrogenase (short-subunit alcohol dehydrogenase family)